MLPCPGRLCPFPRTGGDLDATDSVRPRVRARSHTAYVRDGTPPDAHGAGGAGPATRWAT